MSRTTLVDMKLVDVGEGISEAEVLEWLFAPGQAVKEDQPIVLISTDKAAVELPSPVSGVLHEQLVPVGATVEVGAVLARIAMSAAPVSSGTRTLTHSSNTDLKNLPQPAAEATIPPPDITKGTSNTIQHPDRSLPTGQVDGKHIPLRGHRLVTARSLTRSWHEIPHIAEFRQIDATQLLEIRDAYRTRTDIDGIHLTFLPFFVKAAALALKRHPSFNAQLDMKRQEIVYYTNCNIGVAVANESGLTVPVLKKVEDQSIHEIAHALKVLIERSRAQRLSAGDLQGGTFTITNFGSYGTWLGTPIIRSSEAAIAGFGKIQSAVVARNGTPVVRPVLPIAVATDHRLNDGAHLAAFVDTIADVLENRSVLFGTANGGSQ